MADKVMWKRAWRDQFGTVHTTHAFASENEANSAMLIHESNEWCGEAFSFYPQEPVSNEQ